MFNHVNACYVDFLFVLMSGNGTIVPRTASMTSLMHSFQRLWACKYVCAMPVNVDIVFILKLGKGSIVPGTACLFPFQAICIKHRDPA